VLRFLNLPLALPQSLILTQLGLLGIHDFRPGPGYAPDPPHRSNSWPLAGSPRAGHTRLQARGPSCRRSHRPKLETSEGQLLAGEQRSRDEHVDAALKVAEPNGAHMGGRTPGHVGWRWTPRDRERGPQPLEQGAFAASRAACRCDRAALADSPAPSQPPTPTR
jgi:hypothetical protein